MDKRLVFATSTEVLLVPARAVVMIIADGNYSVITMADGTSHIVTLQLGHIEKYLAETPAATEGQRFIRIGKSLIVNRDFITFINPQRQRMVLSDCLTFRREATASREALKALKELIEKENKL